EDMESLRFARRFAAGRKSGALISGGQFVARLAEHFGLLTEERLQGLTVTALLLPIINMASMEPGGGDEDEEMPQAVPPPPRTQEYQRRNVKCRTDSASTSAAPQQPDP
ncbi:hypothetical protein Tco_1559537, partial [Tanacetum coccineum]